MKKTIIQGRQISGRMPVMQRWGRLAIPKGDKTQTRRPCEEFRPEDKPWDFVYEGDGFMSCVGVAPFSGRYQFKTPYRVGDIRVLTEPLRVFDIGSAKIAVYADNEKIARNQNDKTITWRWKVKTLSARYMPNEAARTLCEITDLRIQQVQDISEADAIAEGVDHCSLKDIKRQAAWSRRQDFAAIYDNCYGAGAWDRNDWVWVPTFKVIP